MPMFQHRPALAAILAAVVAVLTLAAPSLAAAESSTSQASSIAAAALKYDGTRQGQCWEFVKKVVLEATGQSIGFDYREGFFDAGAIEVSLSEAASGDIIQVADDRDTSPSADYPGLHTSIILNVLGNGTFDVVDSNMNFDEVVHVREGYDPAAAASRYPGLSFHIYRISGGSSEGVAGVVPPAGSTTAPAARSKPVLAPAAPSDWAVGDSAVVNTPGDVLNLRAAPGGSVLARLAHRTPVTVAAAAVEQGGYTWVKVSTLAGEGWVAAEYLARESTPAAPSSSGAVAPVLTFRSIVPMLTNNQ